MKTGSKMTYQFQAFKSSIAIYSNKKTYFIIVYNIWVMVFTLAPKTIDS